MAWSRLIRFLDDEDKIIFGEPEIKTAADLLEKYQGKALYASELEGNSPFALSPTGRKVHVKRLLEVLTPADVPIVRCIGLNYMKHSTFQKPFASIISLTDTVSVAEGGRKPPPYPSLFFKPSTCVAGFDEDIPIPKIAQEDQLDYEGELVSHFKLRSSPKSDRQSRRLLSEKLARISPKRTQSNMLQAMPRRMTFLHERGNATPHMRE